MTNFNTPIGHEGSWAISTDGAVGSDFIDFPRGTSVDIPGITVSFGSVTTQEPANRIPITENYPTAVDYGSGSITVIYDPVNRATAYCRSQLEKGGVHVIRQTITIGGRPFAGEWDVKLESFTGSADIGEAYTIEIGFRVIPRLDPRTFGLPVLNLANSASDTTIRLDDYFSGRGDLTYTVGALSTSTAGVSTAPTVADATSILTVTAAASGSGETTIPITATDPDNRSVSTDLVINVA